jgi:alpha-glucan,water dikinase
MAVLVQGVAAADHAFVLHSADPTAPGGRADAATVYGEVVLGAGEALVSAAPGRAAAFRAAKRKGGSACAAPTTLALPSKRSAWHAPPGAVIFRSDSNGEDLPDYAGAGLHDSIPFPPLTERTTDLAAAPLLWDAPTRDALFSTLAAVAVAVEGAAGGGAAGRGGVGGGGGGGDCAGAGAGGLMGKRTSFFGG